MKVETWIGFYQQICILLYDLEPTKFRNLLEYPAFKRRTKYISSDETELRIPLKITDDLYLEGNLSTEYILMNARIIFNKLGIDLDEVSICLRENRV